VRFTPQFAVGFALGVAAAGVVRGRMSRWPLAWLALGAAVPVLVLIALKGSVWTVEHYFWVDLAIAPAIALLLAAVASGQPRPLVWLLDARPIRSLGSFSYSLYLTHAPVVVVLHHTVVAPHIGGGVPGFLVMLALAVPLALLLGRLFAAVFELPFQRHRTWLELRVAIRSRISRAHANAPIGR
jgi:peptidoglycan/LPS O-acetylase OafA/YrhL